MNILNDINLQLHASSIVSNPYTFLITGDTTFDATGTSGGTGSTDITITIGSHIMNLTGGKRLSYYGYSDGALKENNKPISFGKCSPSIYKGATITSVILAPMGIVDLINTPTFAFMMTFSQHIAVNKIIINNTVFDASTIMHQDGDGNCSYGFKFDANDDKAWLLTYFVNNSGKQITITLE